MFVLMSTLTVGGGAGESDPRISVPNGWEWRRGLYYDDYYCLLFLEEARYKYSVVPGVVSI